MNIHVRAESPLSRFQAAIETKSHGHFEIVVFHNMYDREINQAFDSWQARIQNPNQITSKLFAKYIMKKNHMTGFVASDSEDGLYQLIANI